MRLFHFGWMAVLLVACDPADDSIEFTPSDTLSIETERVAINETPLHLLPDVLYHESTTWRGYYFADNETEKPHGRFVTESVHSVPDFPSSSIRTTYRGQYHLGTPVDTFTARVESPEGLTSYTITYDSTGTCHGGAVLQEAEGMIVRDSVSQNCSFTTLRDRLYGQP